MEAGQTGYFSILILIYDDIFIFTFSEVTADWLFQSSLKGKWASLYDSPFTIWLHVTKTNNNSAPWYIFDNNSNLQKYNK